MDGIMFMYVDHINNTKIPYGKWHAIDTEAVFGYEMSGISLHDFILFINMSTDDDNK